MYFNCIKVYPNIIDNIFRDKEKDVIPTRIRKKKKHEVTIFQIYMRDIIPFLLSLNTYIFYILHIYKQVF